MKGFTAMRNISNTTIQNVQYAGNHFFFQNTTGVSMRLSYEGKNGWRFQAVKPADEHKPYNDFNDTGAGQAITVYMGEDVSDVTRPLTVTENDGSIRISEVETGSYVDVATIGDFNMQFYAPDGRAMNNINGVSVGEKDGFPQITLTGSLYDADKEAIYGGGQRFDSANKRGLSLSLYTFDSYNGAGGKGTYTAIPLFLSTRGSALFINRYEPILADFDVTAKNQWTATLTNELMDCYIYTTGNMTDALDGYSNISGYAAMPAEWAQGVMVCRYNPDFGTLEGVTVVYEKLSDIPNYEELLVGEMEPRTPVLEATITKGTYFFRGRARSYYYDGTRFYSVTKKGNPGGYGVRHIVENLMAVGAKPNVVIIEALDYAWLNGTKDDETAKANRKKIKDVVDWLHENDIKLMLYMSIGQMSTHMAGVKDEYYVRADIVIETDKTVTIDHGYEDCCTKNTELIPWASISDNPDSIGTKTQKYLDVTNPEAVDWYMNFIWGQFVDMGVDGCKLDFCEQMPHRVTPLKVIHNGEYVQVGTVKVDYHWHDPSIFGDNGLHHAYSTYFTALFYRCINEQMARKNLGKSFHLNTRGGGIGIQRNIYMWGGDQTRNEKNLSTQILTTLNSGISAIPFCSYDMGGYAYDTDIGGYFAGSLGATPEEVNHNESIIYLRALQFTTFTVMIQTHGDVRNVYEMKLNGYADDYVQKVNVQYFNLHKALLPYIRKWSEVSCKTGMPLVRHLVLGHQDDPNTWNIDDQFTLGANILVAPILKLDSTKRDLYLPAGKWQNMLTGEVYEVGADGMTIEAEADLDQVPVFVNMGSEDYESLLTVFNGADWQAINRGHVFGNEH